MTRATLFRLVVAMLVLTAVISVVMLQFDWNGVAGSTEADDIDLLTDVMIVLSAFVYSIVLVMLGYSIWRYRAKPGDESDGEPIHGNTRLEIAWTVIPTVIVLFGAGYSWFILDEIEARDADRLQVDVTAQQFAWRFEYPEEGVTSTELHVPVDRQAEFNLKAIDVIHSFWVPEWRMKKDAVPGQPTSVVVTPDREGDYEIVCTELCGVGHSTMRAPVVVESQGDFDQWVSDQGGKAAGAAAAGGGVGAGAVAAEGQQIFDEQGCSGCHTFAAAGATQTIGPDLDEVLPDRSPQEIEQSIVDPDAELSPGFNQGIMPDNFEDALSPDELDTLVRYLSQNAGQGGGGQ
ncbi:MAG TPA: cytochrome c oxidase subunit II [Gaiella sp.]|jgi:cytochrome c oxidase subunit 2|nr:cytochrome c oxidase subunit II [Gaiella sp.]HEX2372048.1 cytochrome c oxidase subunit II [Solirubrobacterales bacterium]